MLSGLTELLASRPTTLLVAVALTIVAGCESDAGTEAGVTHPTLIEVAPAAFLGELPCSEREGALTRYVATLEDTETKFRLPSSRPVPCLTGVGFGFVVPGRKYSVFIDGYDTDRVVPRAPGSRLMVTADSEEPLTVAAAEPLAPAWRSECAPTTAVSLTIVRAAECSPLTRTDDVPPAPNELRVPTSALLGGLTCGSEPGQVERLSVSANVGEAEPRVLEVSCEEADEVVFTDVPPRQSVTAFVAAFSAGSTQAFAGAQCRAFTVPDGSVTASCAKLNQQGTLRVDLPAALAVAGLTCATGSVSDVRVEVPGEMAPRSFPPPDCLQPFDAGFAPGAAAVTVTALQGDEELAALTCVAEVTAGSLALAICEQNAAP